MNSNALYYLQPRLENISSRLLSISGDPDHPDLVFDETVFYPEGGGQPCDLGTIGGIPVLSVAERRNEVVHRLSAPLPPGTVPGSVVEMRLDGSRRRDHTEQHSGQHLLSATLLRLFGAPTRSFHLGPERSTIDIACSGMDEDDQTAAESAVNEAIADDYRIMTHVCPPEDIASFSLRRVPPAGESVYRVVEIDGLDYTPCCGTHAGSTAELRLLLVLGTEKYKGLFRVHFVVGDRAIRLARESALAARQAARVLGCEPREVGAESLRLSERLKSALAGKKALLRAWAGEMAGAILAPERISPWQEAFRKGTVPGVIGPFVAFVLPDKDAEAALEVAKALAEGGRAALVASGKDRTVTAMYPGPVGGRGPGLGRLLGPYCGQFGGNGGGGQGFFRATFPSASEMGDFLDFLAEKLQN